VGIKLVVEVLDHAPKGLAAGDRLMLVVLAESANDHTRECFPGLDALAHRTDTAERSVRRTLTRLTDAGLIERVPVGVDRNGAPVYAHRGHSTVYRIARLRPGGGAKEDPAVPLPPVDNSSVSRTDESPFPARKEDARVLHLREKGGPLGPERGTVRSERGTQRSPLPSYPSRNPHHARAGTRTGAHAREETATVIDALERRTGKTVTAEHARLVARQLLEGRSVRDRSAYLRGAIDRDADPSRFLPTPTPPRYRAEGESRHA
jgi:DNA-binding transcriptional ArsR family regulator